MKRGALKRYTPLRNRGVYRANELRKSCDQLCRSIVLIRDGYQCRSCFKHGQLAGVVLQAAHIKPKGRYRSLRFHLDNIITLCKGCHFKQHNMTYPQQQHFFAVLVGDEVMKKLEFLALTLRHTDLVATQLYLREAIKHMT